MPFDFVEIEDNWVPDFATDPYRRKHYRTRYTLEAGETKQDGELKVDQAIKEYIQKNTTENPHIVERTINNGPLPEIQLRDELYSGEYATYREQTLEEQILGCEDKKVLESYKFIAKKDPELEAAYNLRMNELQFLKT